MSKRLVGAVDEYDGDRFFTKLGGKGKTVATPLLLCLVCIELSDFVFAVDSIPAVLGVSKVQRGVYLLLFFLIPPHQPSSGPFRVRGLNVLCLTASGRFLAVGAVLPLARQSYRS